jgi:predicted nucleic acid-binding protein
VAVKWYLPAGKELLIPEAMYLLDAYRRGALKVWVPDLFWVEAGSVFWKAVRKGRLARALAEGAITSLSAWNFTSVPSSTLWRRAFAIASDFGSSVYDSTYVALASEVNQPLVTADERLAKATAAYFPVRWLGSL